MKKETKRIKKFKQEKKAEIQELARSIGFQFKRWGFKLKIEDLNPSHGWAELTPAQAYNPEIYSLFLDDECIISDLCIKELKNVFLKAKRYKHDFGVKMLRKNIKDIILNNKKQQ